MKKSVRTGSLRVLGCGFVLAALVSLFPFAAASETLPEQVVRLHVVANSDTEADQALKLQVRDAVLAEAARWTADAAGKEEASARLCLHLGAIRSAAEEVLSREGSDQSAAVEVTDSWFPTREYETFTLPAGTYRTLRVTLGEGEGHNWWCVVFPALCLPAADGKNEDPLAFLPEGQKEVVEHPQKQGIEVKFKVVELYEEFRSWLQDR